MSKEQDQIENLKSEVRNLSENLVAKRNRIAALEQQIKNITTPEKSCHRDIDGSGKCYFHPNGCPGLTAHTRPEVAEAEEAMIGFDPMAGDQDKVDRYWRDHVLPRLKRGFAELRRLQAENEALKAKLESHESDPRPRP